MLRRIENVSVSLQPNFWGLFSGNGQIVMRVGKKNITAFSKTHKSTFREMIESSRTYPVSFMKVGERCYWLFEGRWYWDNEDLDGNQVHATGDQGSTSNGNHQPSSIRCCHGASPTSAVRGAIPEDVKQLVWTHNQGQCRSCGSNAELQFDHIIPASMGGAVSPENIQVLCGPCNRRKGASVALPTNPAAGVVVTGPGTTPVIPVGVWLPAPDWGTIRGFTGRTGPKRRALCEFHVHSRRWQRRNSIQEETESDHP